MKDAINNVEILGDNTEEKNSLNLNFQYFWGSKFIVKKLFMCYNNN